MRRNGLMLLVAAALLLAAWGGRMPAQASPTLDTASVAEPVLAQGEAVTVNFLTWNDPDSLIALEKMAEAFVASDPQYANVSIEFNAVPFEQLFPTIETAVAAGAEMDLFAADGPDMKHYAYNEAVVSLAEYYTPEELEQWVPQSVEEGSFNGTFYAPPLMQSCSLMFYNADMTEAAGLEPPQAVEGWTMDEAWDAWLKTNVDESGDGVPEVWGLRWGQGTWEGDYEHGIMRRSAGPVGSPTYQGMGEDGITFVGYLDTPEAIASFEDYRGWHIGDRAVTPREAINNIFFDKGAAFYVSPDNAIGTINRLYPEGDFNYGVTGIPYYADGAQVCHTGSWHVGVSPQTQNLELSVAIAKFFAGPEGSQIWYDTVRQLPARVDMLNTLPEYQEYPQQLFAEGLTAIGIPRIQTPGYTEYQQIFAELAQNVAQGEGVEVAPLVQEAAVQMEQALAKYEGWQEE
ncbi:MAG: ABC-type sugar transport system, periplasmic component [Thermomicrobiales bacterium]|jgi:fructooligosaccharide transport system substrate-binding protein|nr:ABC-type sugar transport system, periplasmic component [Thermomicrobiales bacterium]